MRRASSKVSTPAMFASLGPAVVQAAHRKEAPQKTEGPGREGRGQDELGSAGVSSRALDINA
jgi:hypothetical protein